MQPFPAYESRFLLMQEMLMFFDGDIALVTILCHRLPYLLLLLVSLPAFAQGWIQPTPEELKMTVEPAAPDAGAIYLYRDERADDKLHMHSLYVRMKILTDEGKKFADVELVYDQAAASRFGPSTGAPFTATAR